MHRVVTAPAVEPITTSEAKEHLRLETALDDTLVAGLIKAARHHVEQMCWRGIVSQTLELTLPAFPCDGIIDLPGGHLSSITSVKYLDADGVEQTMSTSDYEADTTAGDRDIGRVLLGYDETWPTARDVWNAVRVRYVVGWADADAVPMPIKAALKLLVSQLYEHRTPEVFGTVSSISFAVDALLSPYRLNRF